MPAERYQNLCKKDIVASSRPAIATVAADELDTSKPKFYVLDMFPYPRCAYSFNQTNPSLVGGFYAVNRRGHALLTTVNTATIVPLIKLNNLELAVNLAK